MSLRDAVHAVAIERTWTQGVTLVRDKRVVGRRQAGAEIELEIRVPGRPTPFHVFLNTDEEEWECDCPSRESVCSHVVAAVLAVEQHGGELPQAEKIGAPLRYILKSAPGGLVVQRVVVLDGDKTEPLGGALLTAIAKEPGRIAAIEADLAADPLIAVRGGTVTGERVDRLLAVLAEAPDVMWIDAITNKASKITTSGDVMLPRAVIEDAPKGVIVRIVKDPSVRDVVALGVARTHDDVLHPIGAVDLSGSKLEKLPQRFDVPRNAFGELTATTIPQLASRISVEIRTRSLPQMGGREAPRIAFELEQDGDRVRVFPTLVYGDPPKARIDGAKLVHISGPLPIRDMDAERKLMHRLRDELNLVPGRRVELQGREAFALQTGLASWIRDDARGANAARAITLDAAIVIDGRKVDATITGPGGRTASIGAALRAWSAGVDLVPLDGGGWGRVPMAWFDKHGARLADLLSARSDDRSVPLYALPDLARLCEDLDEPPPLELERMRPLLDNFDGIPVAKSAVTGELRSYQQRGVDWLAFCRDAGLGCVLADDMGLGKTVQALATVPVRGRTLVVSPTSVLFNWVAETKRFRPDLRVATYHGPRRAIDPSADMVLTSYPILRNDIDQLSDEMWDCVILDESQTIKNPDSQVARAAYRLKAKWRITLSGTPIENRLDELWSQLHFTNPGLLGGRTDFLQRWADPIVNGDSGAAARLRERIRPFVLRRMKREVAKELPSRTDSVMYVELDEGERVTYDAIRAATQNEVVKLLEQGGGVMAALEALLRLRQAACHGALLPNGVRGSKVVPTASSKLDRLLEAITEVSAEGHRCLVFSQWTSMLDLIEPALTSAGITFVRLDGSTVDRAGVVGQFQAEDGPPVMLLSLKAGGTGLNLTAADHVFLVDPWWNPAVEDQAADRAHRIGQDKPVMVYRMVARDTVEERILELQDRKRQLANAALSDAGGATAITRDDLLALLL